jgi:DNA polymerase IV (DinB-like DNA polymerase)
MNNEPRTIFHVDMDSFYASVEIGRNLSLKGQPVIVGADPKGGAGRGVVLTCSYEARRYGVRSGMPISKAYRLCPNGVYLPVEMDLYLEVSERVMKILRTFADKFEQWGIDEAFLDVSLKVKEYGNPEDLARAIKKAIYEKEGLTCSIGVAPNKSVAKIASDFKKPDGLTIVSQDRLHDFLEPLPASKMIGVGKKTGEVLKRLGIYTIGQLARYPREDLRRTLGKYGLELWSIAKGIDDTEVHEGEREPKSISAEHTFESDVDDLSIVTDTLGTIGTRLYDQLRDLKLLFKTVTLKIRFEDFETFTRSKSLSSHMLNNNAIIEAARNLLKEFEKDNRKIRLVGIKVSNFRRFETSPKSIESFI